MGSGLRAEKNLTAPLAPSSEVSPSEVTILNSDQMPEIPEMTLALLRVTLFLRGAEFRGMEGPATGRRAQWLRYLHAKAVECANPDESWSPLSEVFLDEYADCRGYEDYTYSEEEAAMDQQME